MAPLSQQSDSGPFATVEVGQVWRRKQHGDRWRVEQRNPYGESGTYLMRAVDGRHEGEADVLWGAEVIEVATLEEEELPDA